MNKKMKKGRMKDGLGWSINKVMNVRKKNNGVD